MSKKCCFLNSTKWSVLSDSKVRLLDSLKEERKQIPIAPLCFRRCSTAIASAAAAADAYGFQAGKQILVDRKSGPTLRFWRGCEKASPSNALLFVWKQSFLSQTKGWKKCKKNVYFEIESLGFGGWKQVLIRLFLIKLVPKFWFCEFLMR